MFSFIKGFLDGFSGFALLLKPGIKKFVIIPFMVNIALFSLATKLLSDQLDTWMAKLLPEWLDWLAWILWPLFAIVLLLIVYYSFTVVANLISAPFNSILSARIEAMLTGQKPVDINSDRFLKLMTRTFTSEARKILYAIKWFVPLLIVTIIPGLNVAAPFFWVLFAAWFFALEYSDYPLANRGLFFYEVRDYNRKNRMRALGLGTAVFVMTSVPVLNFFAMPVSVAAATKMLTRTGLPNETPA